MKVTHKVIQEEAAILKKHLLAGDVEIPSMWSCAWPGILIIAWLVFLPFMTFRFYYLYTDDGIQAMGAGAFFGFMILVMIMNVRCVYLSIPKEFRDASKTLRLLRNKIYVYLTFVLTIISVCAVWAPRTNGGVIIYFVPMVLVSVIALFIFSADVGRYRLSAFTSVLELIKSHKQQGGDE